MCYNHLLCKAFIRVFNKERYKVLTKRLLNLCHNMGNQLCNNQLYNQRNQLCKACRKLVIPSVDYLKVF